MVGSHTAMLLQTAYGIASDNLERRSVPIELVFYFIFYLFILFMHFCPGTMTTHAINPDLQRGLERRLRHTQH